MKKILYIVPHLSTGGLPQYTHKLIQSFKDNYDVYCLEISDITGGILTVQRDRISNELNEKFYSLTHDSIDIHGVITKVNPDIIHFQEVPETFIPTEDLHKIYNSERNYKIVVTTHGSNTNPKDIIYGADKFILVSQWSRDRFTEIFDKNICDVWEYPIDNFYYDKDLAKKELGFDKNYKHVLNVGLFTPGKNQGELIELAKKLQDKPIKFHFVGNQAGNFQQYWEPLMQDLPSNCIWHNERSDVDMFYKAADAFYFTSNLELNPLVVKESLSYGLPTFIKKLPTYKDEYDGIVNYITEDTNNNIRKLLEILQVNENKKTIIAMHMITDIDTDREVDSMISLTKLENYGIEYIPCVNRRYTELPPKETCMYPERISNKPGNTITPAHYGCYLAHKNAVLDGVNKNSDYILVFECDAIIDVSYDEFIEKLNLSCKILNDTDLLMFSFGFHNNSNIIERQKDHWIVNKFYGAHAYLIPKKSYKIFVDLFENEKWNVTDLLYAEKLNNYKIGIFEKPITKQAAGFSILDEVYHEERY